MPFTYRTIFQCRYRKEYDTFLISDQNVLTKVKYLLIWICRVSFLQCHFHCPNNKSFISDRQIGLTLKQNLFDKMLDMLKILFKDCNYLPKAGQVPIKFEDAVYANFEDTYTIFMVPGVLIT